MNVQRYDMEEQESGPSYMKPHPQGDWVEADEYDALLKKYNDLVSNVEYLWRAV